MKVTKRVAIGRIRRFDKNIPLVAVMVNGHTVAHFATGAEADAYIEKHYPDRNGNQHNASK